MYKEKQRKGNFVRRTNERSITFHFTLHNKPNFSNLETNTVLCNNIFQFYLLSI